ncbi:MAG TPA: tRNA dihydrouridine synthase DusB [Candidatus Acidoferrales bacterium]|nr:tRNA dihydrouridine synthase DusB [Candidatus Acidoferrales bacterium]
MKIRFGSHELEKPIALAPMEDVTDLGFRLICKEFGADIVYSEFISSDGLIRSARKSLAKLANDEKERPVGIQIFGGDPNVMAEAARIAESAGPDFIDINAGCWVPKVAQRGAGAGLLKDMKQMRAIIHAVRTAVSIPVTLKTRLGWDSNSITIFEVANICAGEGLSALTIHARTRDQHHDGEANWDWIRQVKETAELPIIGNGDIRVPQDAIDMFDYTNCDGVMVARGAVTNPWIFRDIKHLRDHGTLPAEPSFEERAAICLRHLEMEIELKGARRGILEFRKYYHGYFHGIRNGSALRSKLVRVETLPEIEKTIREFSENYSVNENPVAF